MHIQNNKGRYLPYATSIQKFNSKLIENVNVKLKL